MGKKRMMLRKILFIVLSLLILILTPKMANSQDNQIDSLKVKMEDLSRDVDSELKMANKRFEILLHSTERTFTMFYIFGALGSFIGGIFVFLAWRRDRQSHKDYKSERDFYEKRVLQTQGDYKNERKFYEERVLQTHEDYKTERKFYEERVKETYQNYENERKIYLDRICDLEKLLHENQSRIFQISEKLAERQGKSSEIVDSVMESIGKIVKFQATQAEQLSEQIQKFDFTQAIKNIIDQVKELRKTVTRHNLYLCSEDVIELSGRMKNMEDLFNVPDFKESIGCHYIRGLASLLQSRFHEANKHFSAVSELINTTKGLQEKDEAIEAVSYYFRGVLFKNIGKLSDSKDYFTEALRLWPTAKHEIRSRVELAEVVALESDYQESTTKAAFNEIDKLLEKHNKGDDVLSDNQLLFLKQNQTRLWMIEGNYAYNNALKGKGEWNKAIELYNKATQLDKDNFFLNLSLGITYLKMKEIEMAKEKFRLTYKLVVSSDRLITHPEPRGRILLMGSAIIAARLSGIDDFDVTNLRDPKEIEIDLIREIEELRRINIRLGDNYCIFSPLTKRMETLSEFRRQVNDPHKFI